MNTHLVACKHHTGSLCRHYVESGVCIQHKQEVNAAAYKKRKEAAAAAAEPKKKKTALCSECMITTTHNKNGDCR